MRQRHIGYLAALLEIHSLQILAALQRKKIEESSGCRLGKDEKCFLYLSQSLETDVGELMTSGNLQRAEVWIVVCQSNQRRVGKLAAFADTKLTQVDASHSNVSNR